MGLGAIGLERHVRTRLWGVIPVKLELNVAQARLQYDGVHVRLGSDGSKLTSCADVNDVSKKGILTPDYKSTICGSCSSQGLLIVSHGLSSIISVCRQNVVVLQPHVHSDFTSVTVREKRR